MFDKKLGLVWNFFLGAMVGGVVYGFHHMKYMNERSYKVEEHEEVKKFIDELIDKQEKKQVPRERTPSHFERMTSSAKQIQPDI